MTPAALAGTVAGLACPGISLTAALALAAYAWRTR